MLLSAPASARILGQPIHDINMGIYSERSLGNSNGVVKKRKALPTGQGKKQNLVVISPNGASFACELKCEGTKLCILFNPMSSALVFINCGRTVVHFGMLSDAPSASNTFLLALAPQLPVFLEPGYYCLTDEELKILVKFRILPLQRWPITMVVFSENSVLLPSHTLSVANPLLELNDGQAVFRDR